MPHFLCVLVLNPVVTMRHLLSVFFKSLLACSLGTFCSAMDIDNNNYPINKNLGVTTLNSSDNESSEYLLEAPSTETPTTPKLSFGEACRLNSTLEEVALRSCRRYGSIQAYPVMELTSTDAGHPLTLKHFIDLFNPYEQPIMKIPGDTFYDFMSVQSISFLSPQTHGENCPPVIWRTQYGSFFLYSTYGLTVFADDNLSFYVPTFVNFSEKSRFYSYAQDLLSNCHFVEYGGFDLPNTLNFLSCFMQLGHEVAYLFAGKVVDFGDINSYLPVFRYMRSYPKARLQLIKNLASLYDFDELELDPFHLTHVLKSFVGSKTFQSKVHQSGNDIIKTWSQWLNCLDLDPVPLELQRTLFFLNEIMTSPDFCDGLTSLAGDVPTFFYRMIHALFSDFSEEDAKYQERAKAFGEDCLQMLSNYLSAYNIVEDVQALINSFDADPTSRTFVDSYMREIRSDNDLDDMRDAIVKWISSLHQLVFTLGPNPLLKQ